MSLSVLQQRGSDQCNLQKLISSFLGAVILKHFSKQGKGAGVGGETNILAVTNISASSTQLYSSCASFCRKLDSQRFLPYKYCQYHSCACVSGSDDKQCLSNSAQIAITKATKVYWRTNILRISRCQFPAGFFSK